MLGGVLAGTSRIWRDRVRPPTATPPLGLAVHWLRLQLLHSAGRCVELDCAHRPTCSRHPCLRLASVPSYCTCWRAFATRPHFALGAYLRSRERSGAFGIEREHSHSRHHLCRGPATGGGFDRHSPSARR